MIMRPTNPWIRTVLLNLFVLLAGIGLLVVGPVVADASYQALRGLTLPSYPDPGPEPQATYRDFTIWRMEPFSSNSVNIDANGLRRTLGASTGTNPVWMFGGSAMWGSGVTDLETIPSHFANLTGRATTNFGESGYIARQSLNLLQEAFATRDSTERPDVVVFYDGANEVEIRCRRTNDGFDASRRDQIAEALELELPEDLSLRSLTRPATAFIKKYGGRLREKLNEPADPDVDRYGCHDDPAKAALVARAVVEDWTSTAAISQSRGADFLAVLQPITYLSATPTDTLDIHGDYRQGLAEQFMVVYPLIRKAAKEAEIDFLDLTTLLDGPASHYTDFVHLDSSGNEMVAQAISKYLGTADIGNH